MRIPTWLKFDKTQVRGAALVLACGVLCGALDLSGALRGIDLKTLDWRFRLRDELRPAADDPQQPRRIALIEIDDDSARRIPEPYILWDRHYAQVVDALANSGAAVIAADILWLKEVDNLPEIQGEKPRKTLLRSLIAAGKKAALVLADLNDPSSADSERMAGLVGGGRSLGKDARVIGYSKFAFVNPTPDQDGVIRLQKPGYAVAGRDGRPETVPTFSYLTASAFSGKPREGNAPALIDFSAVRRPFDRFPFHEVLKRAQNNDSGYFKRRFAGKIALIGTTSSLVDRHPTPLGGLLPGVWIHGFAIDTFLSQRRFRSSGPWLEAGLVLALGLAAGLAALWLDWNLGLLCAAALALGFLVSAQFLFHAYRVVVIAGPLTAITLCSATALLYRFTVADRDKRRLAKVLKGYVNPKIVEEALKASDRSTILRGSRRRIAILFADIRGFTKLSEGLTPEEVVRFLNRYLTAMSDIILDHDGTIDKFIGDGIMAFFGAPVKSANASLQAVRVALEMQRRLSELNVQWKKKGLPELKIGVGIHMGDAVVGNIGSMRKMDYTAIGDTTNLASRVESLTKDFKRPILITQDVYAQVKDSIEAEPMGKAEVRGHSSVFLYAVLGLKAGAN